MGCDNDEDDDEVLSQSAESNLFAEMFSHEQDINKQAASEPQHSDIEYSSDCLNSYPE